MSISNNKGLLLIISSPSGAGKTTISKKLVDDVEWIELSVSVTTRKKRKNEIEGKYYYFKSENEFKELINKNKFLEYANVFGYFYGTLKKTFKFKTKNKFLIPFISSTREMSMHGIKFYFNPKNSLTSNKISIGIWTLNYYIINILRIFHWIIHLETLQFGL